MKTTTFNQILTPLDDIKNIFSFLTDDYGFKLSETRQEENFKGKYFVVYRNDNSKLQLEISADRSYFHCEIRRIINGHPAKYSDKDNCIGFESLAILESNNIYEHMDYYAGVDSLEKVLNNVANLFKRNKTFFTTENWIDTKRIERLKDEDFEKKFDLKADQNIVSFFGQLRKQVTKFLAEKGYQLILDNKELAPYDNNSLPENITFQKAKTIIKFAQLDWRDSYFIYNIYINNKNVFEVDTTKQDIDNSVEQTMKYLIRWIEKNDC